MEKRIYSAAGLWKDFDDTGLPFDERIIKEVTEDGFVKTWLYFNGRQIGDTGVSRLLALTVRKKDKTKLPALILVMSSGEPIDEEGALHWAKKGYAVIAVDNVGECDRELFTQYPESIKYANFAFCGRHLTHCDLTAKETTWYEWAVNIRRAISFISAQNYVNKDEVGLISMRDGATIACMVGAFDERLKACAVLFGTSWIDIGLGNKLKGELEDEEERDRWIAGIAPQSYLMYMKTPFYFCLGTNSAETDINKAFGAIQSIPKNTPAAVLLIPGVMEDGDEEFSHNLEKWLNFFIKNEGVCPTAPEIDFEVKEKKVYAVVKLAQAETITDVKIYYARETENKRARHWVEQKAENLGENLYKAQIDVISAIGAGYVFCTVTYRGGLALSSNLTKIKESVFAEIDYAERTKLIYKGAFGKTQFVIYNPIGRTDRRYLSEHKLALKKGPFDIKGISGTSLATFAFNDIKYIIEENSTLAFDIYSEKSQILMAYYVKNYGLSSQKTYELAVELIGGDFWQKICLDPNDFHNESDKPPENWKDCEIFSLVAENEIVLNNVLFA